MAQAARSSAVWVRSLYCRRLPTRPAEPAPRRLPEHLKADEGVHVGELGGGVTGTSGPAVGPPPPPEPAPRPRPEVNTGRPLGWMGWRSCRREPGLTGWRREGGQSLGISRGPGGSCAWRKVGAASPGRGSRGGKGSPSLSLPREGGPAPAAATSLSAPRPISSLWPTRLPPPGCGIGVGCPGRRLHDPVPTQTAPPRGGNVSCWASGSSRPRCPLYFGDFAFVNCARARR